MSAHPLTHRYLEIVAEKANLSVAELNPEDTWGELGIADEDTMRRLADALQNAAADYNPEAHITVGDLVGAKDVAGGLIVTWKAAGLGELTREQAVTEIRDAQRERAATVQEVVVSAKRKRRSKKKGARKKGSKKKSSKKSAKKKGGRAAKRSRKLPRRKAAKRGGRKARSSKKK